MNKERDLNTSVLLMGQSESLVSIDRHMLRNSGFKRIAFCSAGLEVAGRLSRLPKEELPALIVCTKLSDLESSMFLHLIRLHPNLATLPVLLLYSQLAVENALEAARLGYAAVLARPYTQKELDFAILSVQKARPHRAVPCADTQAFEQAFARLAPEKLLQKHKAKVASKTKEKSALPASVSVKDNAEQGLLQGKKMLQQRKFKEAAAIFTKGLLSGQGRRSEVLEGLAQAQDGLGLSAKSRIFWQQAAAASIDEEDFQNARVIFSRLHSEQAGRALSNPLYNAGMQLLKQGAYKAAAQAFLQGHALTPDQPFYTHAGRACQFAINPERSAQEICRHVEMRNPRLGRHLRGYLLAPPEAAQEEVERTGFLALMSEVLTVARYTARQHIQG